MVSFTLKLNQKNSLRTVLFFASHSVMLVLLPLFINKWPIIWAWAVKVLSILSTKSLLKIIIITDCKAYYL